MCTPAETRAGGKAGFPRFDSNRKDPLPLPPFDLSRLATTTTGLSTLPRPSRLSSRTISIMGWRWSVGDGGEPLKAEGRIEPAPLPPAKSQK